MRNRIYQHTYNEYHPWHPRESVRERQGMMIFALCMILLGLVAGGEASRGNAFLEARGIENLQFFGVWMSAGSEASILRFESTLIIPSSSPSTTTQNNIQAFWPGLEPTNNGGVFQNVVTNQGGEVGEWYLLPFSCCSPAKALTPQMRVYPGDSLTNIFAMDVLSGKWYDNYLVTPNRAGTEAGAAPYGGGFTFDPSADSALNGKPLTSTLMTIELQEQGKWNFGAVEWRNILVEANTTETEWCTKGPVLAGGQNFKRRYSMPTWNTVGHTTTCHIAQMVFEGPDDGM